MKVLRPFCTIFCIFYSSISYGQIVSSGGAADLQAFCDYSSSRKTLIYLDQNIIAKNDSDWYRDILNKLNYLPAERIDFLMIKKGSSRVEEVWTVCHPSLSESDYAAAKKEDSIFTRSIDRRLTESQNVFGQLQRRALAFPLTNTSLEERPDYGSGFPTKSILEALYYDSGRFSIDKGVTRVIIFSDMVENSEIASPGDFINRDSAKSLARNAAERFPVNLYGADIHVYGIGYSHTNTELDLSMEVFWDYWLNRSGAYLASYGTQLNLPNPVRSLLPVSYSGLMEQSEDSYVATKLRFGYANDGRLVNSWFSIRDMRFPLEGEYICSETMCDISASIVFAEEAFNLFQLGDVIKLTGDRDKLSGTIGAVDDLTRAPDGSVFSLALEFDRDMQLSF